MGESPINCASDWLGEYGDARLLSLHTRLLGAGICSLIRFLQTERAFVLLMGNLVTKLEVCSGNLRIMRLHFRHRTWPPWS